MEHSRPCSGEWDDGVHENNSGTLIEEPTCNDRKYSEVMLAEPSHVPITDKSSVGIQDEASPSRPSASVSSYNTKRSTSSGVVGPSNQHHSTLVDPNSVESYFKNSRLHFIGTWRSLYLKCFPSFKCTSSNVNGSASARRTSVIHVDTDFFSSQNHPEVWDKPIAVCHSDNPRGTAEISSANYPARDYCWFCREYGLEYLLEMLRLLVLTLSFFLYDFEAYEQVADQFYNILHKHWNKV